MRPVDLEEYELMKDSKYRGYVSYVDKALKNFETYTEWADYISALGKLNKVISSNSKFSVIPRRLKISKRLAQCMHYALPFGVHLKALETYDLIFKSMGTNRLSHELFIYSAGLFPLSERCSIKVWPELLKIYENHFVPLGPRLRPALSGFLSGILHGYEESSDYFVRTNSLLEKVCEGVGPVYFYGCIWDCIASNSSVRLPATNFILSHFDKKLPTEDQPHIIGNNIEVMVCGLIACVQDASVLVQRCALDLLMLGFPMHNSHLTTDDMIRLVTAALFTILRRDMSLNRRLYAWLLGSEVNMAILSHHPLIRRAKEESRSTSYFEVFSKNMVVKALQIILDEAIGAVPYDLKPYKLIVSLMDKEDIGPLITDDILIEYFRLIYLSCNAASKSDTTELLNAANLLFGSLKQKHLWLYIENLFTKAFSSNLRSRCLDSENPVRRVSSGDPGIVEMCTLTEFLLDKVSSFETSADTTSKHLPTLFHQVVTLLTENCDSLSPVQIAKGLTLSAKILTRVQPFIVGHHHISQADASDTEPSDSFAMTSSQPESTSSDLNQNTDTSSIDDKAELPKDEETFETKDPLLEQCLRQYETFYVTFIYGARTKVGEHRNVADLFESLKCSDHSDDKSKRLEVLLVDVLKRNTNCSPNVLERDDQDVGKDWVEPMKIASRLLVDLSTLQTFFQSPNSRNILDSDATGLPGSGDEEVLPEWLRVLVTCSCWLNYSVPLQLVTITALLDLVQLCTTAQSLLQSNSPEDGATPLLILPLLTPKHLKYMEKNTQVFQVVTHWLWTQMGRAESKVRCVELLYQLHSVLTSSDIVEACIGQYLKPSPMLQMNRLDAFRRFASMWHIGREVNAKLGNALRVSDILYKSMLKMLEQLKVTDDDCLKVEAQEWLLHSLLRGDLHRIMDPLLCMLLDQSTARISVLHIKAHARNTEMAKNHGKEHAGKNVYAVSSMDGNVVCHVDSKKEKNKSEKLMPSFASITGSGSKQNQKSAIDKKNCVKEIDERDKSMSLYVNPFSPENIVLNTDFDDFYEEGDEGQRVDITSNVRSEDDSVELTRNRSFPSLEKGVSNKKYFGLNEALKMSSIDLLALSDTIFTKVSEGESPVSRLNRGSFSSDGISSLVTFDNSDIVRSWSFPGNDDNSDLDESTAADEYFGSSSQDPLAIVEEVMSDLLDRVALLSGDVEVKPQAKPKSAGKKLRYQSTVTSHSSGIDHLHTHILLLKKPFDHRRVLYGLEILKNILLTNPQRFLCSCSSTGLVSRSAILKLLARHKKSLFGRGFGGDLEGSNIRNATYLEVIMLTCLYFLRSYYPHVSSGNVTQNDIIGNKEVHISSTEVVRLICSELINIVRASGRSLASYLADMFSRIKLYKIVLHSVLTGLHVQKYSSVHFTQQVLKFNDCNDPKKDRLSQYTETLQKQQAKLLLSLILLEHEINKVRGEAVLSASDKPVESHELKFVNGKSIPMQPLFVTALNRALEMHAHTRQIHAQWTTLVTCSLQYLGTALVSVVTTALKQICHNIEVLSDCYTSQQSVSFPPDYGITQLEALSVICHYCLIDNSVSFNQSSVSGGGPTSSQIFTSLTSWFAPSSSQPTDQNQNKDKCDAQINARKSVLGHLPRVINCIAVLWGALVNRKDREGENCEVGSPRVVKHQILEFLSMIAVHHGTSFLAAMAVVWRERRTAPNGCLNSFTPNASQDQQVLVQLLIGIKAMPIDTLVQTLHQVVKQPAMNQETAMSVEVSALELFVNYTQFVPGNSLYESRQSLFQLFKETPSLSPPAQFLVLNALSQFVHRCPPFTDKKDQKDLQDITSKSVESCTIIAGACLEPPTWLRRNLYVRDEEPPALTPDKEDKYSDDLDTTEIESVNLDESSPIEAKAKKTHKSKLKRVTKKIRQDAEKLQIRAMHQWFMRGFVNENPSYDVQEKSKNGGNSAAQYSVGALTVMAQLLAPVLDVVFGSQEKEKVVNILVSIMYHVTPYLKNHTQRNAASYYASSNLLASLSSYQYTRKAWKKEVMDLMFDPSFFQMELRSLKLWCTIIDNLISQENTTFRDFLSRVSMPQGNSLSIFSSKELEYEQRGQLLKRLAFVIYCGEQDQFQPHMKEILEKLAETVKLPQLVPSLQAQVFLCFRVLLLRMSYSHIVPLWPLIISEILQVMIILENDLSPEYEELRRNCSSSIRSLSSMDLSWGGNGLQSSPAALQLQLAAANFLFLAVQLPADRLPQFQMYRWAFVGANEGKSRKNPPPDADCFMPHISRIADLMDAKFEPLDAVPTPLLPTSNQIRTLQDLHPFFTAMRSGKYTPLTVSQLEHSLELDILDVMPAR